MTDLQKHNNLTKEVHSNSYHNGKTSYIPNDTDKFTYSVENGRETTIYINVIRNSKLLVRMRYGSSNNFLNEVIKNNIQLNGEVIENMVYTVQGLIPIEKFRESKAYMDKLPKPIDYEMFLGQSVPTRSISDGIYFSEDGDIYFHMKVLNQQNHARIKSLFEKRLFSLYPGERIFAKVLLNQYGEFEVIEHSSTKKSSDKVLAEYPNWKVDQNLKNLINENNPS